MKPVKSFRIDPKLIEKANKLGLPLVDIFEAALASTLQTAECPYCRQDLLAEKKLAKIFKKIEAWAEGGNIHHYRELSDALDEIYECPSYTTE